MSIIATLSITPIHEGNASEEIATAIGALDNYDVDYEINPMGTIIETSEISELFAAVQAAHQAIESERVNTKLEINHERNRDRDAAARVSAVEDALANEPANGTTDTTGADEIEELDTTDESGHAPEDVEDNARQDDVNMKGSDYKTDDSDETTEASVSERYYDTNEDENPTDE